MGVPTNEKEAFSSPLMGLFEKKRLGTFYKELSTFDLAD